MRPAVGQTPGCWPHRFWLPQAQAAWELSNVEALVLRPHIGRVILHVPPILARIIAETPVLARAYLVGGCVRDALLDIPVKDYDVEVFGVDYETLARELARWGRVDLVGRSFGVVKLSTGGGRQFDFTIPRRESKVGPGHRGFEAHFDPGITLDEAAARRDFTLNSLMFDPRQGALLDFFGGAEDLRSRRLRHTSRAFVEDPLRVLRGMQFAARFDLTPAEETVALCRDIKSSYAQLAVERVWEEWVKWAVKSTVPSRGLWFLSSTGWLEHFPEIAALAGTPQDTEWHPEGDVFQHTCHCCDALVQLPAWREADHETRLVCMLAVLAHDFAKPQTTREELREGRLRIVSPGHEEAGGPLAEQFLTRLRAPLAVRERVVPLVRNHLAHLQTITASGVRRLARRLHPETIEHLGLVITADQFGRPPKPRDQSPGLLALLAKAAELRLEQAAPKPILKGRHLIEFGMSAGPEMGAVVHAAFEAQLEGDFESLDGAFRWLAAQGEHLVPAAVARACRDRLEAEPPSAPL